jgi:small nuclear ribonucleoprotein (snRNP)-like protein
MIRQPLAKSALVLSLLVLATPAAYAQINRPFRRPVAPGPGGVVNLPYLFNDNGGNIWRIYNLGWMQQQGNMPLFSQGAMLMINGNQPVQQNNQGRIDEKTGELLIENMQANGLAITRRIFFDKDEALMRYIDVFQNTQNQELSVNVTIQSNMNFGITSAQFVPDPKKKDLNLACVAQTGGNQSVLEMYAGKGAKQVPTLSQPQGNNTITAAITLNIPAGKQVALLHLHKGVANVEAGTQYVHSFKETQMLKTISPAIRRQIVNFPNAMGWIGDVELLRGDLLDIVELRSGDQFRGTLKDAAFTLQTFYGPINLPVENVVGLINVGQFRPRQLLVTTDGQIFGGRLKKETLDLQLTSGQLTQIPLAQISRAGYHKRVGEPDEWTFDRPMVLLRTGERMNIRPPTGKLEVATRYGKLLLAPETVGAVSFQNEDNGVHTVFLSDGSKLCGLLTAEQFDVVLDTGNQPIKLPASSVIKMQLLPKIPDIDDFTSTMRLLNDDLLVANLTGSLHLETAFDIITMNAAEIRTMTRAKESVQDVQVVLWDGTTLSGQLQEPDLNCELKSGITIRVPLALLEEYSQPQPRPSPAMLEKINALMIELNVDDWKQRDRAQAALVSMGPVAAPVLRDLRPKQPPEAQKAIDIILQRLEEQRKRDKGAGGGGAAAPGQQDQIRFQFLAR